MIDLFLIHRLVFDSFLQVLWDGKVCDAENGDEDTKAIHSLNQKIYKDSRVDTCMLPFADGVTIVRKR